ncbi:MAG: tetratricopeptide repeat protein, partial [Candidatus Cloacimonetes bacterium]|nr:tetratricopeptide repeat protein [Candidatus Cloacimonadota bacterium]
LKDGTDNELLTKRDDYYIFTYREAVERFRNESLHREQKEIARRILKYFEDKVITRISILEGVIRHAYQVQDMLAVRKYRLKKVALYTEKSQQVEAFREMCEIVQLDFLTPKKLQPGDFIHDLLLLADKAEWATIEMVPGKLAELVRKMENSPEKHLLIGIFYLLQEKLRLALVRFRRAYEQAISGRQRVYLLLKMSEIYFAQNDLLNLGNCLSELEKLQLTPELELSLISQKALYLGSSGKLTEAINLIEEYLPRIRTQNDDNFFIRLGTLHNNLAFLYHQKRLLDEAEKNFHIARKIWEKINYKRKLVVVYNNLGDVALVQGYTRTALEHFEKALTVCNEINCKKIKVLTLLNFGEAYIKIGDFQQAEKYLNSAYEMSNSFENKPFHEPIINNQAIAKSKVNHFGYYINFIREQAPELIAGRINKISPLTKTYFYYLYNIGDYDRAEKILLKHKNLFLESNEHEFYYQVMGFLTIRRQEFEEGLKIVEQAFKLSQQNRSFYAQTINYIRFAECYQGTGDFVKAIDMCNQAENIALQNNFNYWLRVARLRRIKAQLSGSNISLRILIRELLEILCYVKQRNLFLLEMEVYEMLIQIYNHLQIARKARVYFTSYRKSIESIGRGLNQHDEKIFLQSAQYHITDHRQFRTIDIAPRGFQVTANWQEELYDILKIKENYRIKYFIDKTIINLLSPNLYAIVLSNEIQNQAAPYLQHNLSVDKLYSAKYLNLIQRSIEENQLISRRLDSCNTLFVPLRIKTAKVGCLILADKGELPFQEFELDILRNLRLHLSSILIRIREFSELNKDMELMTKLIEINQKFFSNLDLEKLEQEIVSFVLDFVNGKRGFLIKRDKYQNYVYKVALDDSKHFLRNFTFISKSIVSEVQKNKLPLFIHNARDDDTLRNSLEFNADRLSIYCAPIMVDGEVYGLLYLDNYNSSDGKMQINKEFMRLLLIQIGVSLKNAQQYEMLKARNREISTLDNLKNDFINIVSHELKTPLVTLKGYIDRLSRTELSEEARKIISSVEKSVDKLYLTTNDIIDHNRYILVNELDKSPVALDKIMQVIVEEAHQISGNRHMQIRLELEPGLPELSLNWEAFQLMLRNIMLNAIRFTKDFGTIVLGARRSAFQQEEVNNRESVVVYVQDNGIGIPQKELERVFQKFYELGELYAHSSGSVEFKSSGLGLGLSTAGLIANLHDGKIWLNSREGEGTTVFISLPLPGIDEEVN